MQSQLLKKRQNLGVEVLSSSSTKTSDRLSQTTCLNAAAHGSTGGAQPPAFRESHLLSLSPTPPHPHSTHLIYFPVKQFVSTFTDETDYDRIKALPASFYKLNYETQIEFLKKKKKSPLESLPEENESHVL